jgi:hypothetical protein
MVEERLTEKPRVAQAVGESIRPQLVNIKLVKLLIGVLRGEGWTCWTPASRGAQQTVMESTEGLLKGAGQDREVVA